MAHVQNFTSGLIIDGDVFNIPLVSIKRTIDFLEKYAERTEDGDMKLETIGVYKNYQVKVGTIDDRATYDRLIEKLSEVDNRFHDVIMPDASGDFHFHGYFSSIKDEVQKTLSSGAEFTGLEFKMTSQKPFDTP